MMLDNPEEKNSAKHNRARPPKTEDTQEEVMIPAEMYDFILDGNGQRCEEGAGPAPSPVALAAPDLLCEVGSGAMGPQRMIYDWLQSTELCNSPQQMTRSGVQFTDLPQHTSAAYAKSPDPLGSSSANVTCLQQPVDTTPLQWMSIPHRARTPEIKPEPNVALPHSPPAQLIPRLLLDSPDLSPSAPAEHKYVPGPTYPAASPYPTASPPGPKAPHLPCRKLLSSHIRRRRPELQTEYKEPHQEQLSEGDVQRRNIRRERNKKAALRCREKKKREQDAALQQAKLTERDNLVLRKKVQELQRENEELRAKFSTHLQHCPQRLTTQQTHSPGNSQHKQ